MARLIDADAFEKFIKEKYKDGESTDDVKDQMLFDLSYQPTAYDVEKVVKELREVTEHDVDIYENKEEGESWNDDIVSASEAIGIVRRGGVNG